MLVPSVAAFYEFVLKGRKRLGYRLQMDTTTTNVAETDAELPGALGYAEAGAAAGKKNLITVRLDDHAPTVEEADANRYPFWETEYAYTAGEPAARSLSGSFLRFLTNQVGAEILRSHGLRPCPELANPARCQPV
ncbi:type 2 periplasmic-binding domain-containing protein [Actinoplanes awajinensis]|uniref:PBP domain-containing protein n=1 Tax=Actinoplanes awajinensis subsp. mycoplanecinus TaxID=135947 RepID=A0A101JBN8_9ACTN|nr:hypothetical protein [Actinoplanes awajinensis]KUL23791.1 hypothetical protein ADL15_45125 [Actinoplanes awajinensis subsp. mycoplanecinus]